MSQYPVRIQYSKHPLKENTQYKKYPLYYKCAVLEWNLFLFWTHLGQEGFETSILISGVKMHAILIGIVQAILIRA